MNNVSNFIRESDFGFDELFFSRTNKKGVLESGNSVFQRVSQYEWNELLGKPHKVVRHPEMPRGVFQLFWDTILKDQTIGAYVVNQSRDGGFYWVFAMVTPISEGFLSVRLKPSSSIFEIIKKKYSELLGIEKKKNLNPKDSQSILLEMISDLGFVDYRQFMVEALMQELESRQIQLKEPPLEMLSLLRGTLDSGALLQKNSEEIFLAYRKSSFAPLNLEIQAARIGEVAASVAVISAQYASLAKEIQSEINKFVSAGKLVQSRVKDCQFYVCNSILQKEMYQFFEQETKETPIEKTHEMNILVDLKDAQIEQAKMSLLDIQKGYDEFQKVYEEVRKQAIGLEMVNLSGKIEIAKLENTSNELMGLLEELEVFKDDLKKGLDKISNVGKKLLQQTLMMKEYLK